MAKRSRRKLKLKRFTTIASTIDVLRQKRIALLDPDKWDDRNDAEFMRLYRDKARCDSLKALCCTETGETYHHWKVFTQSADGCFIEFDRRPLLASIAEDEHYRAQAMDYIRLDEIELCDYNVRDMPFLKRAGFKPEEEFRIIYTGPCDGDVHFLPIELSWISRIVLNPWLPSSVATSVAATFRDLCDRADLQVTPSKLTNSQTWLKWGRSMSRRRT